MEKTHDYPLDYVNDGVVGNCRIRVNEELGERPVVIATQQHAPRGAPRGSIGNAAPVIAAHLIREGILSEFTVSLETRTRSVQQQTLKYLRSMAPFVFVEEYLEPKHLHFLRWFDGYEVFGLVINGEVEHRIGNAYREDSNREEVENLVGQSM